LAQGIWFRFVLGLKCSSVHCFVAAWLDPQRSARHREVARTPMGQAPGAAVLGLAVLDPPQCIARHREVARTPFVQAPCAALLVPTNPASQVGHLQGWAPAALDHHPEVAVLAMDSSNSVISSDMMENFAHTMQWLCPTDRQSDTGGKRWISKTSSGMQSCIVNPETPLMPRISSTVLGASSESGSTTCSSTIARHFQIGATRETDKMLAVVKQQASVLLVVVPLS